MMYRVVARFSFLKNRSAQFHFLSSRTGGLESNQQVRVKRLPFCEQAMS